MMSSSGPMTGTNSGMRSIGLTSQARRPTSATRTPRGTDRSPMRSRTRRRMSGTSRTMSTARTSRGRISHRTTISATQAATRPRMIVPIGPRFIRRVSALGRARVGRVDRTFAPVIELAAVMAGFDRPWFISGGWAIDLFVRRVTREHEDVEVGAFFPDQAAIRHHLAGWELFRPEDGQWLPLGADDEV